MSTTNVAIIAGAIFMSFFMISLGIQNFGKELAEGYKAVEDKKFVEERLRRVISECNNRGGKYDGNRIICNSPVPSPSVGSVQ